MEIRGGKRFARTRSPRRTLQHAFWKSAALKKPAPRLKTISPCGAGKGRQRHPEAALFVTSSGNVTLQPSSSGRKSRQIVSPPWASEASRMGDISNCYLLKTLQ